MFKIVHKDTRVFMQSETDFRVLSLITFNRAKSRKDRNSKIRKPVEIFVGDTLCIFTQKEWEQGKEMASDYIRFCSGLPHLYLWDKKCKADLTIQSQKIRTIRFINHANQEDE